VPQKTYRPAPIELYEIGEIGSAMHYVYILKKRKDGEIYIGYTDNLKRRIKEHNAGNNVWELVYYEAYKARKDASLREKRLKYYGKALGQLKRRINNSLVMTK
jgi:putative endonuclease